MSRKYVDVLLCTLLVVLVVVDSYLLSSPNLFGRIGLIIFHFNAIRTFPGALIAVGAVSTMGAALSWMIRCPCTRRFATRTVSLAVFSVMITICVLLVARVSVRFSGWSYQQVGIGFRVGAFLLPVILTLIFVHGFIRVVTFTGRPGLSAAETVDVETGFDEDKPDSNAQN
jgi:hypothetical protein